MKHYCRAVDFHALQPMPTGFHQQIHMFIKGMAAKSVLPKCLVTFEPLYSNIVHPLHKLCLQP